VTDGGKYHPNFQSLFQRQFLIYFFPLTDVFKEERVTLYTIILKKLSYLQERFKSSFKILPLGLSSSCGRL